MTAKYAATTDVPTSRSLDELAALVDKHGAADFAFGKSKTPGGRATYYVQFTMQRLRVRMSVMTSDPNDFKFDSRGYVRTDSARAKDVAQDERSTLRALLLVLKAKLVAVDQGVALFEDEFLAYIVTPGGETIGQKMAGHIDDISHRGAELPPLFGPASNVIALPDRSGT